MNPHEPAAPLGARFSTRWRAVLALLGIVLLFEPRSSAASHEPRPDRLILVPKAGVEAHRLANAHAQRGRRVLKSYRALGGLEVVELRAGESLREAIRDYSASGLVETVEPDYKLRALERPDDPEFLNGNQWALHNTGQLGGTPEADIRAALGWDSMRHASNVVVAVIDSGIHYTHEDLAANMWVNPREIADNGLDDDENGIVDDIHGINTVDDDGNVLDPLGHGTHVAGIIGAVGNNGTGIAGVAWKVQLMACRFLDEKGDGDVSDAIQAIDYARKNGAHIINASWGGDDYSAALYSAIQNARSAGIIFVAAAGNEGRNIDLVPLYPASYDLDHIVTVCGTTRNDAFDGWYSNYSPTSVDIAAPGSQIYSTWSSSDTSYRNSSGTSMAAPIVSGIFALMKARYPGENERQLIERLYASADVLPALAGKCATSARVNLAKALGPSLAASFTASAVVGEPPLTVQFTNTSFGDVESLAWHFGDDSPVSAESNPLHTFFYPGEYTVKLQVTGPENRSHSTAATIRVTPNYEIVDEPFEWIDPSGMPALELGDDTISAAQALPFPFVLYGETNAVIYISSNGLLGFETNNLQRSGNSTLPSIQTPNAIIAAYWDDLNPVLGGAIHAGTIGVAPHRRFVVSWVGVPRVATPLTFQAVLEEGSSEIVFQYLEMKSESPRGGARQATVGLEDSSGTLAALFTVDGSPHVIEDRTALRFRLKPWGRLELAAKETLKFAGGFGGPFAPELVEFSVRNSGTGPMNVQVAASSSWMEVFPVEATLQAGEIAMLQARLTTAAAGLASGLHGAEIRFNDPTHGVVTRTIPVELSVLGDISPAWAVVQGESFQARLSLPEPGIYLLEWTENWLEWHIVPGENLTTGSNRFSAPFISSQNRFYRARKIE